MTYCINTPAVIADVLDGEAIIINLVSGRYYSMDGSGAYLWVGLAAGHDPAALIAHLAALPAAPPTVSAEVDAFIARLKEEDLLRETDANSPGGESPLFSGMYTPPVLHAFSDMESMLLLDPIHKVDEAGWPHPATGS